MKWLTNLLQALLPVACKAGGPGVFDSVGGTYDEQTGFEYQRTLFLMARTKTFVGSLARSGNEQMLAGGDAPPLDGTAAIWSQTIDAGDMRRITLQELVQGVPSYGDMAVSRGDYIAYQNQEYRVNQIDSPAIPVQGEMARLRAAYSISDIPGAVKAGVIDYMGEQMDIEALIAYIYGASPSVLKSTASGGLGVSLGIGGAAGVPLMPRHFYTPDGGFATYSTTQATWNSTCNTAVNNITAGSGGYISLLHLKKIRKKMDDLKFAKMAYGGKTYKALGLLDTELFWRIHNLLEASGYFPTAYTGKGTADNPVFGIDHVMDYMGMRLLAVPNLDKLRAFYNSGDGVVSLGHGTSAQAIATASNPYQKDHRNFTADTPANGARAWAIFIGAGSLLEGKNGAIEVTREVGPHGKGLEFASHTKVGYKRGEWFAQDGRTGADAAYCNSVIAACFYEPGIGVGY